MKQSLSCFVSAIALALVMLAPSKASAQQVNIYVSPGYSHYGGYGYYPNYGYGYTYPRYGYGYGQYPSYSYGYGYNYPSYGYGYRYYPRWRYRHARRAWRRYGY
jgi:hypothetical protein